MGLICFGIWIKCQFFHFLNTEMGVLRHYTRLLNELWINVMKFLGGLTLGSGTRNNWLLFGAEFYFQLDIITSGFYDVVLAVGLKPEDAPQFHDWSALREKFTTIFASKTQAEWCDIFDNVDACVTPVLTTDEAVQHPHNTHRAAFDVSAGERNVPKAAPRLSETPASSNNIQPDVGENSVYVLTNMCGYSLAECQALLDAGIVKQPKGSFTSSSRL